MIAGVQSKRAAPAMGRQRGADQNVTYGGDIMAERYDTTLISKLTILRDLNLRSTPTAILLADRKRLHALDSPAFSISVGLLYTGVERDYVVNGQKSIRDLRMRWHLHLEKVFASIPADALSTQQVNSYVTQRLAEKDALGRRPANATINRELSVIKRCFRLAVKEGILKLANIPYVAMLRERNTRRGFLKDEQYADLARETGKIGLWMRTLFEMAFSYGWRKSELLGLKVRQVDMIERTIRLDPGTTKNDQPRTVAMTLSVYELLKVLVAGKSPEDNLFTKGRRNRFGNDGANAIGSFRKGWARATKAAGVEGLLFHDLRRTAVRNMLRCGIPEKVCMEIAGILTRSIFDRYSIVSGEDLHKAVALMDLAGFSRGYHALPCEQQPQTDYAAPGKPAAAADIAAVQRLKQYNRDNPAGSPEARVNGLKSAEARMKNLTPADRSRIAAEAAQARWSREKRSA
jgi:integrase